MEPFREVFWNIRHHALFYIIAAAAAAIFFTGLALRVRFWASGWRGRASGGFDWGDVTRRVLLTTSIFKGDPLGGVTHVLIMWGVIILFIGTVLSTIDHWIIHYLKGGIYLVYAFILDIAGAGLILGIVLAYLRRWIFKRRKMVTIAQDHIVLVLLLAISVTGFLVEGLRLKAAPTRWIEPSPIGVFVSELFNYSEPLALSAHRIWWWIHSLASFLFVAYFPFSKFIHVFAAPVNIALEAMGFDSFLTIEEREKLQVDFSLQQLVSLDACTQCNRCQVVCPSSTANEPLSPRVVIDQTGRFARKKMGFNAAPWGGERQDLQKTRAVSDDQIWYCTTCGHCHLECPTGIDPRDIIREVRAARIESGEEVPSNIQDVLESVYKFKNPWRESKGKRFDWSDGLDVPVFSNGADEHRCFYVGCTPAYDSRLQEIAKAAVRIFRSAGLPFATLGKEEVCCTEFVRGVGEDGLFTELAFNNIEAFVKYGIEEIVTICPHGYHTFRNDYPKMEPSMGERRVAHISQVLEYLIKDGNIRLEHRGDKVVTYHDPCFLGRHNGVYDAPRNVIGSIPGVNLVEMPRSRERSMCCGGGGGRMWMESGEGEKIAEIRVREAAGTGARFIVTSCPFCFSNLDDAVKTLELEDRLVVVDLAEMVAEALAGGVDND